MKVVIFGTGRYYNEAKSYIPTNDIVCFADNSEKKINKYIDDKIIKKPSDIDYDKCDYVIVMTASKDEVTEQLLSLGVANNKIKYFYDLADLYNFEPEIYKGGKCESTYNWLNETSGRRVMLICHELDRNGVSIALMNVALILKKMGYRVIIAGLLDGSLEMELTEKKIDYMTEIFSCYAGKFFYNFIEKMDFIIAGTIGIADIMVKIADTKTPKIWWMHESNDKDFKQFPIIVQSNVYYYGGGTRVLCYFHKYHPDVKMKKWLYCLSDDIVPTKRLSNKVRISVIGIINQRKGQDILIKALDELPEELTNKITVDIVGEIRENIINIDEVKKSRPYINYLGLMTQEELKKYFSTVDILICPSRDDPMPVVVTQAMQNSIACIVSDQVGQSEYISDGVNGFVFRSEDYNDLANKIEYCLHHQSDIRAIGKKSKKIFDDFFSEKVMAENLSNIIAEFRG